MFFTATHATAEDLVEAGAETAGIEELTHLTERDGDSVYKAEVSDSTLASRLVEQEAVVRSLSIEAETTTAVVDIPSSAGVREFIEQL